MLGATLGLAAVLLLGFSGDVQGVASSTGAVSGRVGEVTGLAEETGRAANGVLDASSRVAGQADAIRDAVRTFLREVKAA